VRCRRDVVEVVGSRVEAAVGKSYGGWGELLAVHKTQEEMDQRRRGLPAVARAHSQSTQQIGNFLRKKGRGLWGLMGAEAILEKSKEIQQRTQIGEGID
jgi:hypothetical protein